MNPGRWKDIERVYCDACGHAPAEREKFLDAACEGDEGLRLEVVSLLEADDQAHRFLTSSDLQVHLRELEAESAPAKELGPILNHYRILSRIGDGGMGEVYRARDTVLDREVALKVLKSHLTHDDRRLRRFLREARSASALNHPNIITIYEIGTAGDVPFIASEFIEGVTLRERLSSGPMDLKEALGVTLQCVSALGAAHDAGIIHRDIKPENIMIRPDGIVKVLDFGLARIAVTRTTHIAESRTQTGIVLGTPRYMSPEQARGLAVDVRTDIFSLGAVFYEMITGRQAFPGTNTAEIFAALLDAAPPCPSELATESIEGVDGVVLQALNKDASKRYQTMSDFAADLARVQRGCQPGVGKSGSSSIVVRRRRNHHNGWGLLRNRWSQSNLQQPVYLTALMTTVAAAAYGVYDLADRTWHEAGPPQRIVPFSSFPGLKDHASFSPDASQVAFAWTGGKIRGERDIYIQVIGSGEPLRLTSAPEDDWLPSWSPDGRHIAFLRHMKGHQDVYIIPALGGPERKVAEAGVGLSWSPDGTMLALASVPDSRNAGGIDLLSWGTGELRHLTTAGTYRDNFPAFSPDGKKVAFVRSLTASAREIFVVPTRGGTPKQLTYDRRPTFGLTWTNDSREVVFSSTRAGAGESLWRVSAAGGEPQRVSMSLQSAFYPAMSRQGNRLVYTENFLDTNIYVQKGPGFTDHGIPGPFGPPEGLILSSREDNSPNISPDGKRIAFVSKRTGSDEIWMCNRDGGHPVQLTFMNGAPTGTPRWSPDGKWIAFDSREAGSPDIYIVAAEGGAPRRLTTELSDETVPSWSADGKSIYFASGRSQPRQIWKMPVTGGTAVQITKSGNASEAFESPDGKVLYFNKNGVDGIWSMPVEGGEEAIVPGLERAGLTRSWGILKQGIFFMADEKTPRNTVRFYSFVTKRVTPLAVLDKEPHWRTPGVALSPDGRWLLTLQRDHEVNDLVMIENFR